MALFMTDLRLFLNTDKTIVAGNIICANFSKTLVVDLLRNTHLIHYKAALYRQARVIT